MHTVNKAYILCCVRKGLVKLDRRKGAVVSLEADKEQVMDEMREEDCRSVGYWGVSVRAFNGKRVHRLVDEMYDVIAGLEGRKT